jgi:hypothetical protein
MDITLSKIKDTVLQIYDDLLIEDSDTSSDNRPYVFFLPTDKTCSLSMICYEKYYINLVNDLLSDSRIGDKWSIKGIQEQIQDLLLNLAKLKNNKPIDGVDEDISDLLKNLFEKLLINFQTDEYFIVIHGLTVKEITKFADITFWPIDQIAELWKEKNNHGFLKNSVSYQDAIASSKISAEKNKSSSILQDRVERVLNIIRYFCSIIYFDRYTQYAFIDGRNPSKVVSIISYKTGGGVELLKESLYNPRPIEVNSFFIQNSINYGYEYIEKAFSAKIKSPIQALVLNSIDWFGDATQDINPISSFMKYYTAMESILKEENEKARNVIPERVVWVLDKYASSACKEIKIDMIELIEERNSIFHQGFSKNETPEFLSQRMHNISRNIISRFTLLTMKYNWETKQDFINWVSDSKTTNNNSIGIRKINLF